VADFGVATSTAPGAAVPTPRSRGTECIKSPEMLYVGRSANPASSAHAGTAAAAVREAETAAHHDASSSRAGELCDAWSLGCLFYEVIAGETLFGSEEWTAFFVRLTDASQPLLTPPKLAKLPAAHQHAMAAFLSAVLVRDATRRPSLHSVAALFATLRSQVSHYQVSSQETDAEAAAAPDADLESSPAPEDVFVRLPTAPEAAPSAAPSAVPSAVPSATFSAPRWSPPPLPAAIERRLGAASGIMPLAPHLLLAPRRLLCSGASLHSLGIGHVVCCGVEPPPDAARADLGCTHLPAPIDVAAASSVVSRLMEKDAAGSRSTLLVGDDTGASCCPLAAALLERSEGLSAFEAAMRMRQACPIGTSERASSVA